MTFRFAILSSGSVGNCALLETAEARVLIDAGLSTRRTQQLLATLGTDLSRITAIFLTHEHGDHSAALLGLSRFPHIKVYANHATARALQKTETKVVDWQLFETGTRFLHRDLEIESFSVPHDAQDPVGFVFTHGHDDLFSPQRRLAWLTDLGHVPENVRHRIQDVDILSIESNHCPELLRNDTRRPWSLRQRISGRHGHLSNTVTRTLLDEIDSPRWRHIFLTHLSRDCNSPETVAAAFVGARWAPRCALSIVPPGTSTTWHDFA